MSNSLVIVALPAEDELVYKVSSEKVPHLTLMYLGEESEEHNVQRMAEFVDHALNMNQHGPFYLDVDYRGELGEDKADVLFFNGGWEAKWIKSLRSQLLKQNDIRDAYEKADKFPDWVPHLTLGYPASPAKELPEGYTKIYGVQFDRIAIWTGNYEGPEFRLKWPERDLHEAHGDDLSVAWSTVEEGEKFALEHFGVKGMRWGVRKEDVATAAKSAGGKVGTAARAVDKFAGDVVFEARTHSKTNDDGTEGESTAKQMVRDAAENDFRKGDLPEIKAKPEYASASKLKNRLLHPLDPTTRAYRKEVKEAYIKRLEKTANSMKNASGNREYTIRERGGDLPGSKYFWEVSTREARHAAEKDEPLLLEVLLDDSGFITGTKVVEAEIKQAVDLAEHILEHYGVKGMRWGVRKEDRPAERKDAPWLDPEGKDLSTDVVKSVLWPMVPPLTLFAIPAQVRLVRGGARATNAKIADMEEKRFAARAMSEKNFVEINNRASPRINRDIPTINKKYPGDLTKNATAQKRYDNEILKLMQDSYKEAANSIGNKNRRMHLDVEFKGDGQDFKIVAKEGRPTPIPKRVVQHAAEDEELEFEVTLNFSGAIERDSTGHITGLKFEGIEQVAHSMSTTELGQSFLEHYGVKGMRWGVRRMDERSTPLPREPVASSVVPPGAKRKTKVKVEGGENHDATEDAIQVALAAAKLKKSGPAALTNRELQQIASRIELEDRVTRATRSKGNKFVRELIEGETKSIAKAGVRSVTGRDGGGSNNKKK